MDGVAVLNLFGFCPGGKEITAWIDNEEKCGEAKNCAVECEFKKIKKDEKGGNNGKSADKNYSGIGRFKR